MKNKSSRAETGIMVFGRDWPGIFVRGDVSQGFKMCLMSVLDQINDPEKISDIEKQNNKIEIEEMINLFGSSDCNKINDETEAQRLKDINKCR